MSKHYLLCKDSGFDKVLESLKLGYIATRPTDNWACGEGFWYFIEVVEMEIGNKHEQVIRLGNSGEEYGFKPFMKFIPSMEDLLAEDWEIYGVV